MAWNKAAKGSIIDIRDRLMLWSTRPGGRLLKVEFGSDFARRQVVAEALARIAELYQDQGEYGASEPLYLCF